MTKISAAAYANAEHTLVDVKSSADDGETMLNSGIELNGPLPFSQMVRDWITGGGVVSPFVATQVLPQDLMAQFTAADIATVQAAIAADSAKALLWFSFLAQRDPMEVANQRFLAGWQALVGILGQPRMNEIATALNATSLTV